MKITDIRLWKLSVPLRVPFKTRCARCIAWRTSWSRCERTRGAVGWGEAPPTGKITGDTFSGIVGAIRDHIAPSVIGREVEALEPLLQTIQSCVVKNTSAKAAVDMAVWDLYGQKYGLPVYRLLGGGRTRIETDITISVNDPEVMAEDTREAIRRRLRLPEGQGGREPGAGRAQACGGARGGGRGHDSAHRRESGVAAQGGRAHPERHAGSRSGY